MEFELRAEGYPSLLRAIDALPGLMRYQVYGRGMLAAARVARTRAQQLVPQPGRSSTGRARGNLKRTVRAGPRSAYYAGRRVPGSAAYLGAGGPGAYHAFLVERGHGPPVTSPPYPYLVPAVNQTTGLAFRAAQGELVKGLTRLDGVIRSGNLSVRQTRLLLA